MRLTAWFLLAGVVAIGFSMYEGAHQRRLRREGIRTEGLVIRHRMESAPQGASVAFVVVNFVDAQGGSHEFQAKTSGVKGLPVGGRASVLYLPDDPETARLDLAWRRFGNVSVPLLSGIALTAVAIWFFFQ